MLARATSLKVELAADHQPVERDTIYVSPSGAHLAVEGGELRILERGERVIQPVDELMRSLAEDQGGRAVGVILSGSGSDGAAGIQSIKNEGGITFAQDSSSKFEGMPHSAVATGSVDFVLAAEGIASELLRIASHRSRRSREASGDRFSRRDLAQLFPLIQRAYNLDFTHYKPATVERRIRRRMAVHKLDSLTDYLALVKSSPGELDRLYDEILIGVTGFFRDPLVFEAIRREVIPALIKDRDSNLPLRVWVPGCATGEEVYSLAMTFLEVLRAHGWSCPVQIFGTDVNDAAIEFARAGIYPHTIAATVTPEQLHEFFTETDDGFRVSKIVRDCCVFARQNLTTDPPFSKLDLISCRNLLIYFGPILQQRVMSIFHYALRSSGFLLLGSSESIGHFADLFTVVDRRHRIYRKIGASGRGVPQLPSGLEMDHSPRSRRRLPDSPITTVAREADRALLERLAIAGVVVNDAMEILQFRGKTSDFLELAPGAPSFQLLKMAKETVAVDLRAAIHAARKQDQPVRRQTLGLRAERGPTVQIEVIPFRGPSNRRYFLILFENVPAPETAEPKRSKSAVSEPRKEVRLRRELEATREYLQSIIDEQEVMNEELRSAGDLIESSNEELQNANEELETAKEELQSTNEELTTLNEELENRNQELGKSSNDLANLLASVDVPILMLDSAMRVRRFSPGAQRILNIAASDIGRSIDELHLTLQIEHLQNIVDSVIGNLEIREVLVQDRAGRSYLLRARPYKTMDNVIDGVVLVLLDAPASGQQR